MISVLPSHQKKKAGFTLIELLLVVAILSILASVQAEGYIRLAASAVTVEESKEYRSQVITHSDLQWTDLQWSVDLNEAADASEGSDICTSSLLGPRSVALKIEATGAVVYALRVLGPHDIGEV